MTETSAFGSMLRRFRRAAEMTQEELAERAGLSARTVSDLERGSKHTPQAATLELLAEALGLSGEDRRALLASVPRRRHQRSDAGFELRLRPLPAEVTPLIGRERDEASAVHLLRSASVRLLTLIGPGGVGKTRLALRVAATLSSEFADGACYVPLAAIADPSLVATAVAAELGLRGTGHDTSADEVAETMRGRELLLVLDNFEQVTGAALLVGHLLEAAPRLTILVTSRSPLRLRAEHLLDVPPLRVPAAGEHMAAGAALRYPAIALFVQRAQTVRSGFALTDERVPAVGAICRRLDGLPLALELAAAQVRYMSPEVLLRRLQGGVDGLAPGPVDAPPRQQTMRDTIAWSYDLLSAFEQRLFRQLSVFVGGWSLEAAEAVCGEADDTVLALLTDLVDKNLVLAGAEEGGEPRFSMLETVREYAHERADAAGEEARLRERHAAFFVRLAHEANRVQKETGPSKLSLRLRDDQPNLLAALAWLEGVGRITEALALAGDLVEYWIPWGYVREGREWLERLLARADATASQAEVPPWALVGAGRLASLLGDFPRAAAWFEQGAAAHHRAGSVRDESVTLNNIGTVAHMQTDYERALIYYERALALAREIGHLLGMAMPLTNLGIIAMQRGEFERSAAYFDEALMLWRELGYDQKLAVALGNRGALAYRQGQYDEAVALQEEALAMKRAMGDMLGVAHSLGDLARAEIERGDCARAQHLVAEALAIFHGAGQRDGLAECLEALALIAQRTNVHEHAARLYAAAAVLRRELGIAHHPADVRRYEQAVAALRESMSDGSFEAAWKIGSALPLEHILRSIASRKAASPTSV